MKQIIVLGGGRVGSAIAYDLSVNHSITVVDINIDLLQKITDRNSRINTLNYNLSDTEKLKQIIQPYDLVVCAVPGCCCWSLQFIQTDSVMLSKKGRSKGNKGHQESTEHMNASKQERLVMH